MLFMVRGSGVIRETKNAMRVEMFKHYFLKENMTLEEVIKFCYARFYMYFI